MRFTSSETHVLTLETPERKAMRLARNVVVEISDCGVLTTIDDEVLTRVYAPGAWITLTHHDPAGLAARFVANEGGIPDSPEGIL